MTTAEMNGWRKGKRKCRKRVNELCESNQNKRTDCYSRAFRHKQIGLYKTRLPAVDQPALMIEGGWGNFSFYDSNAWIATNVGTQKVSTEHITEKNNSQICTDPKHRFLDCLNEAPISHQNFGKHMLF